jgi:tetratricopeptide (TPR) repeat protein
MAVRSLLVIAPLILVAGACSGTRQTAADFIRRGDDQMAARRFSAAAIEYRNAIKKEPVRADAHRKLADTYLEQGKLEDAYRSYASAIDLDAADVHSRVEAGRLLFGAGRFNEALVRAEQALERENDNVDAQILAGRALLKLRRLDEATAQLDAAVAVDRRPEAFAALADARLAAGDPAGAEAALRAAVASSPQSIEAHVALARYLTAGSRHADAEREFLQAVASGPANEMANRAAASFYLSTGRDAAAEPYLKTAAAQPNQKLKSTFALVDYYVAAHRYLEARAVLDPMVTGPSASAARVRLAAIELETGSPAAARQLLDGALKRRPSAEALALNAQLLTREGKPDDALAAAQAAIQLDPRIAAAHYVAGSIELDRGHLATAEREFREVLRQNRLTSETNLQLARTTLAAGRPREAIQLASAAGPSLDARLTLARALIADGQTARARGDLLRIAADHPTSAEPSIVLGSLELAEGSAAAAGAHATHALALAPDSPDALQLAARAAIAASDSTAAEGYLSRAIAVAPSSFDSHAMLAQVYASRGDLDRARVTLERFAAAQPNAARPRTALGMVLEAAGRPADARARYEQALALDPGEPIASHNLARLYAADEARVGQALELARTAVARLPGDADVHDTLGWVAFRAGRLSLAASELERAVEMNASEPTYRSHLQEVRAVIAAEAAAAATAAKKRAAM